MGIFNNRELATLVWLTAFLAYSFTHANVRKSFVAVLRTFFCIRIQAWVWLMLLYCAAIEVVLAKVKLWNSALLKDTAIWFCVVALSMMFRHSTSSDSASIFRKVATDTITATILLEFLLNNYTFSLPVELVIGPVATLLAMMAAYGSTQTQYAAASRLVRWILAILGFVVLAHAIGRAFSDLRTLGSMDTVRNVVVEPILSLLLIPLLYAMSLVSMYEQVFLRLDLDREKDPKLVHYARRRIRTHAGLSLGKLHRLLSHHAMGLMDIRTQADVDLLMLQAETRPERETTATT
jgi:hypothetical protein